MEQYPITFWYGIPKKFLSKDRIIEAKECGFNIISCSYDAETNLQVLRWCEELGLLAIVQDSILDRALLQHEGWEDELHRMSDIYRDCPALLWYHLKDEPMDDEFPLLGKITSVMKACDPAHPVYINLLPCIAFHMIRGIPLEDSYRVYENHVRNFLDTVKPEMLSYDHYSFRKREVDSLGELPEAAVSDECRKKDNLEGKLFEEWDFPGFFENLEMNRRISREYGVPLMNIILVVEHWFYRLLGEPEIRFEAYNSIAYGVDILSYFTYWTPGETGEPWSFHHGIINGDGTRDVHYDMIKSINREISSIGAILKKKTSSAVFHVGGTADKVTSFSPFAGISSIDANDLTVGFFQ